MKRAIAIFICIVISIKLLAQQKKVTRDFGAWAEIAVQKGFGEDFDVSLMQQVRFHTNATEFDDYILDLGGKYKINKNFKLGANLRYKYNANRWKESDNRYRYNLDLLYDGRISEKTKLNYRLRYQKEFVNYFSEVENTNINSASVRNELKIKYTYNNSNTLFTSAELFRSIVTYKEPYFDKIRLFIGDDLNTKIGSIKCSLGYERQIQTKHPLSFLFIKTVYKLKL